MSSSFYCDIPSHNVTYLNSSCPIVEMDNPPYDFGIFLPALQSGVVNSTDFPQKFFYCFWWGLQNLRFEKSHSQVVECTLICRTHSSYLFLGQFCSSLGQNLKTSTFVWEICFAVFISISGLVLFSFLIGNMQVGNWDLNISFDIPITDVKI